jgi:hypothetical protein
MINQFQKLNIEPQAIEQPLDLNIPENKMMLAFYLAAPEVENDRRSINVIAGMRRAKKEGRWMATAPMGYKNTRDENGKAIIVPGPRADLIQEAFEEFATGTYTMEDIRLRLRKKGLKCSKNQFPSVLRNPVYIGKIYLPAYKDEEAQYVKGIHEPLVSETLIYKVQEIMEGRRPNMPSTITKRDELPLRGYLVCKRCGTNLTGSASKGNGGKYFYYHCQYGCKERFKAEEANEAFYKLLRSIKAKPEVLTTYQEVLEDIFLQSRRENLFTSKRIKDEIEKNRTRIRNAQKLMLDGDVSIDEYKDIKSDCLKT